MHNRHFDRYAPRRRNESRATARRGFDDRLNRIRRVGAFDRHRVLDQIESAFDFLALVAAARLDETGDSSLETIQLHIRHRRTLHAPDLMAHHDAGKKISEWRRPGIMTAGFVALVGNKTVPFHRGTEL